MKAYKYIFAFLFLSAAPLVNAGLLGPMLYGINAGQSELNIMGGVSYFSPEGAFAGEALEMGGSGAVLGMTAVQYITPHFALGAEVTYSDNGKGAALISGGKKYYGSAEHTTAMFYAKAQFMPQSPLRLYIPIGIGADYLKTWAGESNTKGTDDRSAGIALMFGIGAELEVNPYTFIGVEYRYNYNNYFGGNEFGVKEAFYPALLFKAGMRFDGDIFL